MKQIFFTRKGEVRILEVPAPTPSGNQMLVRNVISALSIGTELQGYHRGGIIDEVRNNNDLISKAIVQIRSKGVIKSIEAINDKMEALTPRGYSGAGIVVEKGAKIRDFQIGDLVAYIGSPHAEFVLASRHLATKVPESVSPGDAAFGALLCIAMHAVRNAEISLGDFVVVLGLGMVGQLVSQLARRSGARVLALDLHRGRVEKAISLGAEFGIIGGEGAKDRIFQITGGRGADKVILCAGVKESGPTNEALSFCRDKGAAVMIGAMGLHLERESLYQKEIEFLVSRSYGPGRYDPQYENQDRDYPYGYVRWTEGRNLDLSIQLLNDKSVNVRDLISHEFPFSDAAVAYHTAADDADALGVVLKYDPSSEVPGRRSIEILPPRPTAKPVEKTSIAVIGTGNFFSNNILPVFKEARIRPAWVIDTAQDKARFFARKMAAARAGTDFREAIEDPDVGAVMIFTRHDSHYRLAKEAILAGKAVHVEKPMAMTLAEAADLEAVVRERGGRLAVGYNRRFSPLLYAAKTVFHQSPLHILYRVNASKVPAGHWVNDAKEGGGRLIGEACHFIDMICYLIGGYPSDVRYAFPKDKGPLSDEFTLTMDFNGGSQGTIFYTSLGNSRLSKERLEIFQGGKAAVIEDFRDLRIFEVEKDRKLKAPDATKGIRQEILHFFRIVGGTAEPKVTERDGLRVAQIIEESLKG